MNAYHKRKTSRLYLQEYLPPVIKKTVNAKKRNLAKGIISNVSAEADTDVKKDTDKNTLRAYIPPTIDVTLVEMENGIAANSGFALPVKAGIQVDEIWDNADIKPDQPIYW
ncbi:hypothetical protein CMT75_17320 [Elizabethkingia anophelis]|uniref:hypothetical protein n=1 Tax=Elizabethkingia anophelis TaxID=1117645 RepID=UPI000CE98001|nr:hypothetical protein [Elizabethkingia anophelis]AVF48103.1 hypothetical protein AL491_08445 [Elizabethkingia anophelis]AVF52097.1 hypothetical protein AL492_10855 [Elizabethkingia anophelis]MBG0505715.1 hypothetical protein [Elizabethkingia anophelis]MCT4073596.1 hypothetical protein [Elizabethkingia anophelis]MCT4305764.1 hypothetical protein [Elizabethkingia anophelis]